MATILKKDLPSEVLDTLKNIKKGPPYPYHQDGKVFHNRENLLPIKASGYYSEFTVETLKISSRGGKRIIVGKGGEIYYTDDHYKTFREVII